ncbi:MULTISPECIES: uracil-DNA glycosylase family protein [Sorangium]|uniref:uracil-DNA glycosylase family protein n=1 Tax=Sorangium TaxID=39643 RepID=UPI003D9C1C3B
MTDLETSVRHLQVEIARCPLACHSVEWRPAEGHLPRGLWLDIEAGEGDGDVIIVGQNPGQPSREERKIYTTRASRSTEEQVMAMNSHVASNVLPKHLYYTRMRNAARELGFKGRILWTDLVKCSATDGGKLPVQAHLPTYSRCMNTWLRKELAKFPQWPVLTAGRATLDALWPLLPERLLVGVPHPTGSRGDFAKLFLKNKLAPQAQAAWEDARRRGITPFYLRRPKPHARRGR